MIEWEREGFYYIVDVDHITIYRIRPIDSYRVTDGCLQNPDFIFWGKHRDTPMLAKLWNGFPMWAGYIKGGLDER